ncbi:MAG: hypothetical protein HY726_15200 [Candidatus Rokubacteria bacterium]|nr:hypothetical protein [Candidatus Rokubacteria bacterium]
MSARAWLLVLLVLVLAGCASGGQVGRSDDPVRVRCLTELDPRARSPIDRPLIFLFCIQTP